MPEPATLLILGRVAVFASALMLWGAALFRLRLMPRAAPLAGEALWPWVLLGGLALSLPARVADMGAGWPSAGDPAMMWLVLTATTVGKSWLIQMAGAIGAIAAWHLRWPRLGAIAAAITLGAQAVTGHAAASAGGWGVLRQMNDVAHLWAVGAWLGALPFVLRLMQQPDPRETRMILIRYSQQGHIWVALVLATGIIATLTTVGGPPMDWGAPYQALLTLKIITALCMVGLAVRNRYGLVPRLSRSPAARRAILRNTGLEIALGAIAVCLVAALGLLDPRG